MLEPEIYQLSTPVSDWTPTEGKLVVIRDGELSVVNYSKPYSFHTIITRNGEFYSNQIVKNVTHVLEISKLCKMLVKTRKKTWLQKIKSLFVNADPTPELPEVGKDYEDKSWSDTKVRVLTISKNKLEVRYKFIMASGTKIFEGSKHTLSIRTFLNIYEKSNE